MKKKIFLLLASSALLASCSLPGASSSGAIFSSSGAATSSQGATSGGSSSDPIKYESTTREKGVKAMSDALAVTLKQDKIGISGYIEGEGFVKGNLGITTVDGESQKQYIEAKADIDYRVNALANGLTTTNPFQAVIEMKGQHDLSLTQNKEKSEIQGGGYAAFYAADSNVYFDVDSGMADVLDHLLGYPYGEGKWVAEEGLSGMPSPLLDEATAKEAVEGFTKGVNEFMEAFGDYIAFGVSGNAYQAKAVLDSATLLKLAAQFKDLDIDVAYTLEMLSHATFEEAVITFAYDTAVGFKSVYVGLDGELKGALKDIFPKEAEVPAELADEILEADVDIAIDLAADYGRGVELPKDLDTYRPTSEASSHGQGSQVPVSKEISPDELRDFLAHYDDPEYQAVSMRDASTFEVVKQSSYGDDDFDEIYNSPVWHLTDAGIATLQEVADAHFYVVDSAVEAFITIQIDENTVYNYRVIYGNQYGYHYATYADINVRVSGVESKQSVFIEWYTEPQATQLTEEELLNFIDANTKPVTATSVECHENGQSRWSMTADDPKWAESIASYKYHLDLDNAKNELLPEIGEKGYAYVSFLLSADGETLQIILVEEESADFHVYAYVYDVEDGLLIKNASDLHIVDHLEDESTSHVYSYEWHD